MELRKIAETSSTITLGWTPTAGAGGYVLYAGGQVVSVATRNLRDGSPRSSAKFSKTNPGPPFHVIAVVRTGAGAFVLDVGAYAGDQPPPPPPPPPPTGDWPASYFTGPLGAANPLPPKGRAFLGIFPNTIGFDWARQRSFVAEREAAIGRRFDLFMFAYPPEVWSQDRVTWVSQNRYVPVISGLHWGTTVNQVAAGANDAQIRALADELKTKPLCLIRMFHEFDNPHVPYTAVGREQAFVDAWKRTVEIFQQRGATNVGWYVCPNEGHTRSTIDRVRQLLPESYYDWAGSDWYNWCFVSEASSCWSTPLHGGWAEFWEVFNYQNPPGGERSQHDQWGPRKPFVIGETNTVYDAQQPLRKGDWYRNVVADARGAKAMQHLVGVIPYDADVSSAEGGKANFLVDHSTQHPGIFDGFKQMARDPYWHCRGA